MAGLGAMNELFVIVAGKEKAAVFAILKLIEQPFRERVEQNKKTRDAWLRQIQGLDADRKQPLPLLPRTVGFITSPTGAAARKG